MAIAITSTSDELGWAGTRAIELLRRSGDVMSALRWAARPID
jgi:hypothetical protein